MELHKDFKELLGLFNSLGVEYLLVGGYALACHGAPRFTGDMDLWIRPTPENARRVLEALNAFGFGELDISPEDLTRPRYVIQLGYPPVRIDLLTSIDGVDWDEAQRGKCILPMGDQSLPVIGRKEFIQNKRALGRLRDLADLESLGEKPSPE